MKKIYSFGDFKNTIARVIEGEEEINDSNKMIFDRLNDDAKIMPDNIIGAIKEDLLKAHQSIENYTGFEISDFYLLIQNPLEYNPNKLTSLYDSERATITAYRENLARDIATFFKSTIINIHTYIALVQSLREYNEFLKNKISELEKKLEEENARAKQEG